MDTLGPGPIGAYNSGVKVATLNAHNHRSGLGPKETSISDANHTALHAQNDRSCLGPIESCYFGPKVAVLHPKTTDEGWYPWRLVILMLGTPFCIHKMTGDVWDP